MGGDQAVVCAGSRVMDDNKAESFLCPHEFCFFWAEDGTRKSSGLYQTLDDALTHSKPVDASQCACSFGVCTRLDPIQGDHDWYEPHEPRLAQAGLPWH
jgi:hypothetical protein